MSYSNFNLNFQIFIHASQYSVPWQVLIVYLNDQQKKTELRGNLKKTTAADSNRRISTQKHTLTPAEVQTRFKKFELNSFYTQSKAEIDSGNANFKIQSNRTVYVSFFQKCLSRLFFWNSLSIRSAFSGKKRVSL